MQAMRRGLSTQKILDVILSANLDPLLIEELPELIGIATSHSFNHAHKEPSGDEDEQK